LLELRQEIDPRKEPALTTVLLAQACTAGGDTAAAEQMLRQAATAQPGQVVLLDALGKLLERQGSSRLEEAIGYYRTARGQRHHLGLSLSRALISAGRAAEAGAVMQELVLLQPDNPAFHFVLGAAACYQKKYLEAQTAYRKVIDLKPEFAMAHGNLGSVLGAQGKHGEAEAALRKAIALKADFAEAHSNLGNALSSQGKHSAAEAACRKAIVLKPDLAYSHNNLGNALLRQQRYGEAEAALRKAIALDPDFAHAYTNLGIALGRQGKYGAAEAACRKAIARKPDFAEAHSVLGNCLMGRQSHGEAEAAYRKAIALNPNFAEAYNNLGSALSHQGKHGEAEAAYREAIALQPSNPAAHYNLGSALGAQGKHGEAEAACRKVIALWPDFAKAHINLGNALVAQGKLSEGAAAYRKAITLRPDLAAAHYNLGNTLWQQAQFDDAAAALHQACKLLPAKDPLREQARQLQQRCQRLGLLDARLPAILKGTEKPANTAEQVEFARLCHLKKLFAAAVRFYADAFAAEPKLGEDVPEGVRYDAACAAALAGCAPEKDADKPDGKERARLRRQARDWLRKDLTWWARKLENGTAQARHSAGQRLQHWQSDPDLASVRDRDGLARLPDEEREQWERLWSEVDELLRSAKRARGG
jgi:tetratricopeptide (TPR) repeat protein